MHLTESFAHFAFFKCCFLLLFEVFLKTLERVSCLFSLSLSKLLCYALLNTAPNARSVCDGHITFCVPLWTDKDKVTPLANCSSWLVGSEVMEYNVEKGLNTN